MIYEPGTKCTVNGGRDLMFDRFQGSFIDEPCVIVKVTKAGLIQVALESDPKVTTSVPQHNITMTDKKTQDKLFELNELTTEQMCEPGLMEAIVEEVQQRALISVEYKKERDEAKTNVKYEHFNKKLIRNNEETADLFAALERVAKAREEHGTIDNVEGQTTIVSESEEPTS